MGSVLTSKNDLNAIVPAEVVFAVFMAKDGPLAGHFIAMSDPFAWYRVPASDPPAIDDIGSYHYMGLPGDLVKFKTSKGCLAADMFQIVAGAHVLPELPWHGPGPIDMQAHIAAIEDPATMPHHVWADFVSSMKRRIGQDLFFATELPITVPRDLPTLLDQHFGPPKR